MEKKSAIIVKIEKNDLLVGSLDLAIGFDVEHRAITKLIEKYKSEFEEFGIIAPRMQIISGKRGRPIEGFSLNEGQSLYLATLLTNTDRVRSFKRTLSKQFIDQRSLLYSIRSNKIDVNWVEKRESGIVERHIETQTIKDFVIYAKNQGSKNSERYYENISKMENRCLFSFELLAQSFPNIRNVINARSLDNLRMADRIVTKYLKTGMDKSMYYKDIYKLCKEKVEQFADVIGKASLEDLTKPQLNLTN